MGSKIFKLNTIELYLFCFACLIKVLSSLGRAVYSPDPQKRSERKITNANVFGKRGIFHDDKLYLVRSCGILIFLDEAIKYMDDSIKKYISIYLCMYIYICACIYIYIHIVLCLV